MTSAEPCLDENGLAAAVRALAAIDPALAAIADELGTPPLWARQPGFQTLLHIILEQQVSLASARAALEKLLTRVNPLTPEAFLRLDDAELREIGFSRQKTGYGRELARAIAQGELDVHGLSALDDEAVRAELMRIKGIGRWTADIYLLMALLRPDVWPRSDLALAAAVQQVKGLAQRPTQQELLRISQFWHPWRSVAARLLWHHYLSRRRSRAEQDA